MHFVVDVVLPYWFIVQIRKISGFTPPRIICVKYAVFWAKKFGLWSAKPNKVGHKSCNV